MRKLFLWFVVCFMYTVGLVACGVDDSKKSSDNTTLNSTNKIVPVASITIDGLENDWTSVSPIKTDPAGDANGNGSTDLVAFYAAKSSTTMALMIKTQQNIAMPHTFSQGYSHYEVGIHMYTDDFCNNGIANQNYIIVNNFTSSDGTNYHRIEDYTGLVGTQSTNVAFAANVLETSFDLTLFPVSMKSFRFNPYTQSFGQSGNIKHDDMGGTTECYKLP